MKKKTTWMLTVCIAVTVISGGTWWHNTHAANQSDQRARLNTIELQNFTGLVNQSYNLTEQMLNESKERTSQLPLTNDDILKNVKLTGNSEIISTQLKKWSDYNRTDGFDITNDQVADNQIFWVVKVSYPDGYDTRRGYYNKALVTCVIDPQTGSVIEQIVIGDRANYKKPPFFDITKTPDAYPLVKETK